MAFLFSLLVIGAVIGWLSSTLTEGRGGLGAMWSLLSSTSGSLGGGVLFAAIGERLVGEGPLFLASLLAGVIGAIVILIVVGLIKR
jgi:uncharacterized membrane protein YeaQ/YmgE (transglycosylase-associated protein family)